jgi:cAMP-binding proteins - catabolite gene activator and regulatory subunit of cAMP-dependent protein kinases
MRQSFGEFDEAVRKAVDRSFLADLPESLQDRILSEGLLYTIPAATIGYREYEPGRLIIMLRGLLRIFMTSREGRQITIKYVGPGDVIGTPSVVCGPFPVRAQVIRDSVVLILNPQIIEEIAKREPGFGWKVAETIGEDFYDLVTTLSENVFDPVPVRTARHLMHLAAPAGASQKLVASVTQQDLADSVGSVREVISRVLHSFRDEGLLELERDGIVILDVQGLKKKTRNA